MVKKINFDEPMMRPPQESGSVLARATVGCTWNKCNFCTVSRGYLFGRVSNEMLEKELLAQKPFYSPDSAVYLTGANPFSLPSRILKDYLEVIKRHFPKSKRISMQTRIDDIARKTDAELLELRQLGLGHLYTGVESGDEDVLRLMRKGHSAEDTVRQLQRLDAAGITYTCFYVLGLGGKGKGKKNAMATAAMFNKLNPERITTTGLTLLPGSPVAEMVAKGELEEASEREKIEELATFLRQLDGNVFYDGVHYLNPVHYRFNNADKESKEAVLADIAAILAEYSDAELELMVNRKTMQSL